MPIKECTYKGKDGKTKKGFKWGDKGKCYPTRAQALKQMRAIKARQT